MPSVTARIRHVCLTAALWAAMPRKRLLLASALLAAASMTTSCTLTKPIVCAVTTPVYVLGNSDSCGCDPRGAACGLAIVAAVGAAGGLITGIISDINVLTGEVADPLRNIHDPFATNLSGGTFR